MFVEWERAVVEEREADASLAEHVGRSNGESPPTTLSLAPCQNGCQLAILITPVRHCEGDDRASPTFAQRAAAWRRRLRYGSCGQPNEAKELLECLRAESASSTNSLLNDNLHVTRLTGEQQRSQPRSLLIWQRAKTIWQRAKTIWQRAKSDELQK